MYKPFGEKIIIKKIEEEIKSGMVIPKSVNQEEKALGEIVEVNVFAKNYDLCIGDIVVYDEFAGSLLPYEENLIIINIKDVLAVKS